MEKLYLDKNVYDAAQERFDYIFSEFDNIYVSFSGGKDSGLLLNLVMDYVKRRGITITLLCRCALLEISASQNGILSEASLYVEHRFLYLSFLF